MQPIAIDVARGMVAVSASAVCWPHGRVVLRAKTVEPIEMPFGADSCESQEPLIDGAQTP